MVDVDDAENADDVDANDVDVVDGDDDTVDDVDCESSNPSSRSTRCSRAANQAAEAVGQGGVGVSGTRKMTARCTDKGDEDEEDADEDVDADDFDIGKVDDEERAKIGKTLDLGDDGADTDGDGWDDNLENKELTEEVFTLESDGPNVLNWNEETTSFSLHF